MTKAEYHDGTFWQNLASETYVDNLMGMLIHSSYCGFSNNTITQNLTANTWVKLVTAGLTYFGNNVGNYLSANNTQTGRIVKINPTINSNYVADASIVLRSSSATPHNINIQIVKNGVLNSLIPLSSSDRVTATNVNQKFDIKCPSFIFSHFDYVELYIQSTVNTTITPTDFFLNIETL